MSMSEVIWRMIIEIQRKSNLSVILDRKQNVLSL